jgi:shikimate dehydrogenase
VSASSAVPYDLRRLGAEPLPAPFYAVIGHPVAHSRSPAMQQAALQAAGIRARYVAFDATPADLPMVLELLPRVGARGCNITVPHKLALHAWIERHGRLAPSARQAGAVNTIAWEAEGPVGHSTDGAGWEQAVAEVFGLGLAGLRILILGAGGAGRTLALHAADAGSHVALANRSPEKAAAVADAARANAGSAPVEAVPWTAAAIAAAAAASDLVVHATALGLDPGADAFPFGREVFAAGKHYYDLAYGAAPTPFLKAAAAAGGKTAAGLSMLLHQGLLSFQIWHPGLPPEKVDRALAAMRKALAAPA